MSHGAVVTRAGIVACPEFNASFVLEQAHSLSVEAAPDVVFGATESVPFTLSVTADNTAFSTSLQSTTDFSAPDDPLWGTCFEMGAEFATRVPAPSVWTGAVSVIVCRAYPFAPDGSAMLAPSSSMLTVLSAMVRVVGAVGIAVPRYQSAIRSCIYTV